MYAKDLAVIAMHGGFYSNDLQHNAKECGIKTNCVQTATLLKRARLSAYLSK